MNLLTLKTARRGFTLVELLVVIAIIAVLIGTLLPAVQSAREAARRTGCSFNIRGLAQAIMVYESTKKRLPAGTDRNETTSTAGSAALSTACTGYSWIFHLLPYMEEGAFYTNVVGNTTKLQNGPFHVNAMSGQTTTTGQPAATVTISQLICPSFGGGSSVETTATGPTTGLSYASEYNNKFAGRTIALTNYMGMAGTHMALSGTATMPVSNGALQLTPDQSVPASVGASVWLASRSGITAGSVSDGQSKSVFVAESKEHGYAAWIDGTATWVVAYLGSAAAPINTNGTWYSAGTTPVTLSGLNYAATTAARYLPPGSFNSRIAVGKAWGPGSDHQGGITMHVFGDTHVSQITGDIDPGVYLSICSRNGQESTSQIE